MDCPFKITNDSKFINNYNKCNIIIVRIPILDKNFNKSPVHLKIRKKLVFTEMLCVKTSLQKIQLKLGINNSVCIFTETISQNWVNTI